jgi:hypothetical protein
MKIKLANIVVLQSNYFKVYTIQAVNNKFKSKMIIKAKATQYKI